MNLGLGLMLGSRGGSRMPNVSSLSSDVVDPIGGDTVVITGANLAGASTVTIGGTAATITGNTSSSVTITTPAMVAGVYNLVITAAAGVVTLAGGIEVWTPGQITGVDGYFDARKGLTLSTLDVTSWLEQTRSDPYDGVAASYPTLAANAFGNKPGVGFSQAIQSRLTGGTSGGTVPAGVARVLATGNSMFAVGKWTSTDATNGGIQNPPLTIISDGSSNNYCSFGASAGVLRHMQYAGGSYTALDGGAGLNDGTTRLVGVTHAFLGHGVLSDVKFYSGTTQVGATQQHVYNTTYNGWNRLGGGYANNDGMTGTFGAFVIVKGVISAGELAKLAKWAASSFGAV